MNKELKRNIEAKTVSITFIVMIIMCVFASIFNTSLFFNTTTSALTLGNPAGGNDTSYVVYDTFISMVGIWGQTTTSGILDNISVGFNMVMAPTTFQCAFYTYTDYSSNYVGTLISKTAEKTISTTGWKKFTFPNATGDGSKPTVTTGTKYYICIKPMGTPSSTIKLNTIPESPPVHAVFQSHIQSSGAYKFDSPMTGESTSTAYYCIYGNYTGTTAPTITGESPTNSTTDVSLQPRCNVTVTSPIGHSMKVTFATNESNPLVWINKQTNTTGNGSVSWVFTDADTQSTTYYWRVYCNDGTTNVSEIYHFTTTSVNGTYELLGLTGGYFTFAGNAGDTLWANDTSDGTPSETLIIHTNDTTKTCTDIYLVFPDFDSEIYYTNLSIEVINATDGSWTGTVHQVTNPGGNVTLNATMWGGAGWCHGTNPFPITGDTTIHVRLRLISPDDTLSGTYLNVSPAGVTWKLTS